MVKSSDSSILWVGAAVVAAGVLLLMLGGGSGSKPAPKPGPKPGPDVDPPEDEETNDDDGIGEPPDEETKKEDDELRKVPFAIPGVQLVDLRQKAPQSYVMNIRSPNAITAAVIHQTGFAWKPDNALWDDVKAHFVVMQDGQVYFLHHPLERMRYGSSHANKFAVTIEHEGNYPSAEGKWYQPEKFGAYKLQDFPAQWKASRALIAGLKSKYPTLTHIYAHRQWEYPKKANCPGPDLWRAVGEWAKKMLGLKDGGDGWHYTGGGAIPASWRTPWTE